MQLRQYPLTLLLLSGAVVTTQVVPSKPAHAATDKKKSKKKDKKAAAAAAGEEKEEAKPADGKAAAASGDDDEDEGGDEPKGKGKGKGDGKSDAVPAAPDKKEDPVGTKVDPLKRTGAASLKVETTIDTKQFARTQQADAKRDEAIEELKKLIPKAPAGRKAEMIFRLAELYWEKSKYKYSTEMQAYEKAFTDWNDSNRAGKEPNLKDFNRESELIKQNALKLYEKVLTEYPTYERNDEVLFYLGYNEYEGGDKKKAVSHYWTLIKQFPESKLVPDAYLQLGEHFFSDNKVDKARKAFERALASKSPKIYNYALYKLAWCDYNVQEYAEGIKKLKEVISKSETGKEQEAVRLKGEALGDLSRFFSYVDEVETAFDYFKAKGGEDIAVRYTTKLGELFHDQGKWDLEIKTYDMLNTKYAMHTNAPALQSRIVQAYSKLNRKDLVRKEVERLVDLYRPGTPWYKAQEAKGDKAALEYAFDLTESNLRDLVTEYHRDAQKRKDEPTYKLARDIYAKYLDAFAATDSAYRMRFFYAEVLWALKEWKNAALQYDIVARDKPKGEATNEFARNAAFNAILAWEKIVSEGEKGTITTKEVKEDKSKGDVSRTETKIKFEKLQKGQKYEETPIPEAEKNLSAACDLYFSIADKKDADLPAIKFKAAFIYYKHNSFVEAAKRYNEIIERWPGSDLSRKAANLILDSLNVQEKWDDLEHYARGFRDAKALVAGDKKFAEEIQTLIEGASFKSILTAEAAAREEKDAKTQKAGLAKAATRFRGFQKEFADSQYADKAVFNALTIYDKADELDNAIEAAELLLKKYEKSDLLERTHFLLAGFNERIADFSKAAKIYSEFVTKYPSSKQASDALFNAGVYYQGMGESKEAIDHFTKYTKDFAANDDASEVYWRICQIYDADKNWKKSVECYGKFKETYKKASGARQFESRYRVALAMEELKQKPAAMTEYKWLVGQYPKLTAAEQEAAGAKLAAANAAFELLEVEFKAYQGMKITLNKQTLISKAQKADELACIDSGENKCKKPGKYLSVLSYGNGDFGIAALTRMGQVFRNMADSIRNAPLPGNLDEDQREIYRSELDNVALGPEEKAIEAFENALNKAYELNVYNKWTLLAQENLKQLNPNKFPDQQKVALRGAEGFNVATIAGAQNVVAKPAEAVPAPEKEPSASVEKADGASE